MAKTEVKISVREMVEFIHRGGDLDSRFMGRSRAHEGTKAHQIVQKRMMDEDETYESEVTLKLNSEFEQVDIIVSGRADGIFEDSDGMVIDEIKSTLRPLKELEMDANPLHWMQGMCYAYIYALDHGLEAIKVQLTYVDIQEYKTRFFMKAFTFEALEEFYLGLLNSYLNWASKKDQWIKKRNVSIKACEFPFDSYRNGQLVMAKGIYKSIREKKKIFVQAPTGIGKTVSSLFPAIKALGEDKADKLMYLTAKTITRTVAEETLNLMASKGLDIKSITLTAKDKICFEKGAACTPEECPYARGHFNRVNDAIGDIFDSENLMTRDVISSYAKRHKICPFEFSLDLSMFADVVICDYNYVFDPRVYLKRFFDISNYRFAFLVDEAHNLVDRSREMFSSELFKQDVLDVKRIIKGTNSKLEKNLNAINKELLRIKKEAVDTNTFKSKESPEKLFPLLRRFNENADKWLTVNHGAKGHEDVLELYFAITGFLRIGELFDEMYVTYYEVNGNNLKIKLFCAEPSKLIGEALERCESAVFFSATLMPMNYFKRFYCFKEGDYSLILQSPFDKDFCKYLVGRDVATTYKNREKDYGKIARYLGEMTKGKAGNYIGFFSSYKYMNNVYEIMMEMGLGKDINIVVQAPNLNEEEREAFLNRFNDSGEDNILALCVLGGIFSEGIDLKRERLIGTAIIGVGLPMVCLEREIIREHHEKLSEDGFLYAYVYPGINKVLQAAGRLIRTDDDEGVVVLLDERYERQYYSRLLPSYWELKYSSEKRFVGDLDESWGEIDIAKMPMYKHK